MFNVCNLIEVNITYDDIGQPIREESNKKVFCEVGSITRNEWTTAGQLGVKPSLMLTVNSFEYNGEVDVEFKGYKYSVYRAYTKAESNKTELYLEMKVGDDNG